MELLCFPWLAHKCHHNMCIYNYIYNILLISAQSILHAYPSASWRHGVVLFQPFPGSHAGHAERRRCGRRVRRHLGVRHAASAAPGRAEPLPGRGQAPEDRRPMGESCGMDFARGYVRIYIYIYVCIYIYMYVYIYIYIYMHTFGNGCPTEMGDALL